MRKRKKRESGGKRVLACRSTVPSPYSCTTPDTRSSRKLPCRPEEAVQSVGMPGPSTDTPLPIPPPHPETHGSTGEWIVSFLFLLMAILTHWVLSAHHIAKKPCNCGAKDDEGKVIEHYSPRYHACLKGEKVKGEKGCPSALIERCRSIQWL